MKIQVQNDLHIEMDKQTRHTLPGGETLLLAGDVCVADCLRPVRTDQRAIRQRQVCDEFFKTECAKYDRVYYVMGNHEHYHGVFNDTADILREYLKDTNVTLLDKEWVALNDEWLLFGATLWTDYNNGDWFAMFDAKNKMNDHHIIEYVRPVGTEPVVGCEPVPHKGKFVPQDALEEHRNTIMELVPGVIDNKEKKIMVMTHHAPCEQSVHPRYAGDRMNYAYFTELGNWIAEHTNIKHWFHGHMHDTFDYMVGECRVVCNPRGYVGYMLNEGFNPTFELEI